MPDISFHVSSQDRSSRALKNFSDATERLNDKNLAIETKSNVLETQLGILNDRMDDIEERQKRSMNSNTTKVSALHVSKMPYLLLTIGVFCMVVCVCL